MPTTEQGWKPDPELLQRLTTLASDRLRGNRDAIPADIIRAVVREGVPRDERTDYVTAVARELQRRSMEQRPDRERTAESIIQRPPERQPGFGFGERPEGEKRSRPPTRRHL